MFCRFQSFPKQNELFSAISKTLVSSYLLLMQNVTFTKRLQRKTYLRKASACFKDFLGFLFKLRPVLRTKITNIGFETDIRHSNCLKSFRLKNSTNPSYCSVITTKKQSSLSRTEFYKFAAPNFAQVKSIFPLFYCQFKHVKAFRPLGFT